MNESKEAETTEMVLPIKGMEGYTDYEHDCSEASFALRQPLSWPSVWSTDNTISCLQRISKGRGYRAKEFGKPYITQRNELL